MKNATVKSYPPVKVSEMEFLAQNVPGKMALVRKLEEWPYKSFLIRF